MMLQKCKVRGQRSGSLRSRPNLAVSGLWLQLEFTYGYEMMHTAWNYIGEVPYCFSKSSVKFLGHTTKKIVDFDPNWGLLDCNSSLNLMMAMKWCTKLEAAWKRCPIVFQGNLSNKFQGHTEHSSWAFPDCKASLNSPMDLKWRTKLDVV